MENRKFKHSYVIDTQGYYKDIVSQKYTMVYDPPPLGEDGEPDLSAMQSHMEWVPECYTLQESERLVDEQPPAYRTHAGTEGVVKRLWTGTEWIEGATPEEITAWELEHPAPDPPGPTPQEDADAMLVDLDYRLTLIEMGVS